jgi:subtilisin family serine protease
MEAFGAIPFSTPFDNRATIVNWAGTAPDDGHSHGTHVAGSVAGDGTRSNGVEKGMAPNASIYFQAIMAVSGALSIPSNTSLLFQQAYDAGARIHTNSWGSNVGGAYTSRSQDVDWFLFNNPDMIILYSAGNNGVDWSPEDGRVDNDNIGAPASAKNCLTVGAGENNRSTGGYQINWGAWGGWRWTPSGWSYESKYPKDPINSDSLSDDPRGLAGFSSRGPTDDGRIKPDVFAPGTNILSCRSSVTGAGTGWGVHDAYYVYMGGTSMSTPITAGAMALVRQFYNGTLGMDSPSGALMKATMINGAMDMTPGQYGAPNLTVQEIQGRPDMHQGWGRINVSRSLDPEGGNLAFIDNLEGIGTDDRMVSYFTVSSSDIPLRLTMAYSDAPASTSASITLVNDLDLQLIAPNGSVYNGNDMTSPFNNFHDRLNPVEGIEIATPSIGTWKVIINGYNVPIGEQHYALVGSGDISNFSSSLSLDNQFYSTEADPMGISVFDNDLIGQGTVSVTVSSDTDTTGVSTTLTEVGNTGLFKGVVWTRNSTTGNGSSIQVSHDDIIEVRYTDSDPAGTFNVTAVAKDPVRLNMWFKHEYELVQSEGETLRFEGMIDENVTAWWMIDGISAGWTRFHDDGNMTHGDITAYDLNLTYKWIVPSNLNGNYSFLTMVQDPFLGNRTYSNFILSFNDSIPRYPKNVSLQVIPSGNTVRIFWDLSNESDLSYYRIYSNSSSSISTIAPPGWTLEASTSGLVDNYNVSGLEDGREYSFRVSVVDIDEDEFE